MTSMMRIEHWAFMDWDGNWVETNSKPYRNLWKYWCIVELQPPIARIIL
jgi:hypothetical protein